MKKYLILALLIIQISSALAQQLPVVSHYMYDFTRTNPGSLGSNDMICTSGIIKQSMIGMPGAPQNLFVNASVPFNLFGAKHGAGLSVYRDEIGLYSDIDVRLGYAFRFTVGEGTLGVGINGGLRQKSLDGSKLEGNGTNIEPKDDRYIPQVKLDANSIGFGAGVFYRSEGIYFGASVLNVYATEIDYTKDATGSAGSLAKESLDPHYYVTAGYSIQLANPSYEIDPSVQFYSDGVSVIFDVNGTLTYNKKIWGGVSYRAGASVIGMAGISVLDGLKVGLAYDFNTSSLNKQSQGGYEVLLNYCFKLGTDKSPERYKSIRYL